MRTTNVVSVPRKKITVWAFQSAEQGRKRYWPRNGQSNHPAMMWVGANEEPQRIRAVRHSDPDHHCHSDDDMTQDTVDQLVDRTTGCSKIKLERRKAFFLKQGESNGGIQGSLILTNNPKEVDYDI